MSTEIDLNRLRSIAEAATPGPWAWCGQDDGTVELRGPGHFGKLDARLISAARAEPCFAEILDPDEDLDAGFPETTGAPTPYICDSCKAVWRRYQAGDGDAFDRYRCPKPENTETVWVNEPGQGHIVPINRFVSRQREHRADIEPGMIDHPNAQFIQSFNPAIALELLAKASEVGEMVASGGSVIDAAHIERQRRFSARTFGPGLRVQGLLDHLRKELAEIEADPTDLSEYVDVIILAIDGAWRAGHDPQEIIDAIVAKQARNEARTWPDWRTVDPGQAIEHDRTVPEAPLTDGPSLQGSWPVKVWR